MKEGHKPLTMLQRIKNSASDPANANKDQGSDSDSVEAIRREIDRTRKL